ncbi:hypothetical protein N0V86_009688 [Didymella sp. IMI 355093]|nr:hypothetical protein N0V86_009688 [Didymella sp. IMI 355093]
MTVLKDQYPWIKEPLVINAPMADNAGCLLAATVTLAGGFGLIGSKVDMNITKRELSMAKEIFASMQHAQSETLPLGVGFLPFILKLEPALEVVKEFKPAVVWLFAAKEFDDYAVWAKAVREVSPKSQVGHGFEKGAGIISLLPETADALEAAGYRLPLLASGGIMDGRGVAAAVSLGAAGVVMGTRFLASKEALVHPIVQASIVEAKDGGQVTTRSKLFDQLRGPNIWPEMYDGRSLVIKSHKEYVEGASLEEIQKKHNEALKEEGMGWKTGLEGRAAIWAGTGVGLAKGVQGASDIVRKVRDDARRRLTQAAKF